jgi:hypothetical protein
MSKQPSLDASRKSWDHFMGQRSQRSPLPPPKSPFPPITLRPHGQGPEFFENEASAAEKAAKGSHEE